VNLIGAGHWIAAIRAMRIIRVGDCSITAIGSTMQYDCLNKPSSIRWRVRFMSITRYGGPY
jgi:hypothetical protein